MHQDNRANSTDFHDVDHLSRLTRWMTVCSRTVNRVFSAQLAAIDLSPAEFILLWTCGQTRNSALSQKQLASMTGVSPAQISQIAERLRRRGLIMLARSSEDRRRQLLELTAEGAEKLQAACQSLKEPATTILGEFADLLNDETAALLQQLAQFAQQARKAA